MSEEIYRKAGRGGAGNYFSPKDSEEISTAAQNDIEAQKLTTLVESNNTERSTSEYAYSGRGGAGNLYCPKEVQQKDSVTSATPMKSKSAQKAFFGRGGAGNYNMDDSEGKKQQQISVAAMRRREEEVVNEVERGLRPPEKAYLSPERADAGE